MKMTIKEVSELISAARKLKSLLGEETHTGMDTNMLSVTSVQSRIGDIKDDYGSVHSIVKCIKQVNDAADKLEQATVTVA